MELSPDTAARIGTRNVMVFDGVCALCNFWVRLALRADKQERLHFVIAQSDLGAAIYTDLGLKSQDYDSFIVIADRQIHTKLHGVFALFRLFGGLWHLPAVGRFIPRILTDLAYDLVAKNRYRVFGRYDECMIPSAEVRARFIGDVTR